MKCGSSEDQDHRRLEQLSVKYDYVEVLRISSE